MILFCFKILEQMARQQRVPNKSNHKTIFYCFEYNFDSTPNIFYNTYRLL